MIQLPTHSRVAIFREPRAPLEVRSIELRPPRDAEILIQIRACGLCGSDLHMIQGRRSAPTPLTPGHEICGTILDFGPDALRDDLAIGDRVTWTLSASCGDCFFCENELPQKCESLFKYGHESVDAHPFNGGLGEHLLLRKGTGIVKLPDLIPSSLASSANCAVSTVAAALRNAGGVRGRTVLVMGAGMLGLVNCAMASVHGATRVLCFDPSEERASESLSFGADACESSSLGQLVMDHTSNRGVDVIFEMSGARPAMQECASLLRIGGRAVFVGAVYPVEAISLEPETIVRKHLTIQGVHNYIPSDLQTAIRFLSEQHESFPWTRLFSEPIPLDEVNHAIELAIGRSFHRVIVQPESRN